MLPWLGQFSLFLTDSEITPRAGGALQVKGSASSSETISTRRSSGPGWCFGSVSYDWKFAGLQIWQYLLRLCPTFPCQAYPLHAGWGLYASMQLAAAVGCEKWKPPATNSEFKESVRLCNASETLEKKVLLNTLLPPSHLLKKKEPRFLRSDFCSDSSCWRSSLGNPD